MSKKNRFSLLGKLGRKIFWAFGVTISCSLIIMIAQGLHCSHRAVLKSAHEYLDSVVDCKKEHLEFWFQERSEDIALLGQTGCLTSCSCRSSSLDKKSNRELFSVCNIIPNVYRRSPAYEGIYIFDKEGKKLSSYGSPLEKEENFIDMPLIQSAFESENPVFGSIYLDENSSLTMMAAYRILGSDHLPSQVLVAKLNIKESFEKLIQHNIGLGHSGQIYIEDSQGREIISYKKSKQKNSNQKMIRSQLSLEPFGIVIVAEVAWKEAMAELFIFSEFALVTAGVTLLLMFFITLFMSRKIVEPILDITLSSRRVALGDFEQQVEYNDDDEIGMLAQNFNNMVKQLATSRDEREEKHQQLQKSYRKQEKMQEELGKVEALAATGRMAANIVHEVRNPLSSIKMNLQILTRRLSEEEKYKEHGNIALEQTQHMESMLNELLNFARPVELHKKTVDFLDVLENSIDIIHGKLVQLDVKVKYPEHSMNVTCDQDRLQQVLSNIILNGAQASLPGQEIKINFFYDQEQSKMITIIQDKGKGISPDDLENIYEPFFTLREGGTGLGLSHARKLVLLHGGNMKTQSELKKGTIVTISLPQAKEKL